MKKLFTCAAIAAAALASVSAQAAQISFASGAATDGSYKTTPFLTNPNVFVETFDQRDATGAVTGCGLTQPGAAVTGGSYAYGTGTVQNSNAAPLNDTTCYAYGPANPGTGSVPADLSGVPLPTGVTAADVLSSITIDYAGLLGTLPAGSKLNYFGLYYGSIDSYNMLEFFDGDTRVQVSLFGGAPQDAVYGSDIIGQCSPGCTDGDQQSELTNLYVNLILDPTTEAFTKIRLTTWGIAVEADNFAVGTNIAQIPEPASLALLGVGLAGLGLSRRRKAAK